MVVKTREVALILGTLANGVTIMQVDCLRQRPTRLPVYPESDPESDSSGSRRPPLEAGVARWARYLRSPIRRSVAPARHRSDRRDWMASYSLCCAGIGR
jgi:hypothetical protein